jgi:hypothetical protein
MERRRGHERIKVFEEPRVSGTERQQIIPRVRVFTAGERDITVTVLTAAHLSLSSHLSIIEYDTGEDIAYLHGTAVFPPLTGCFPAFDFR